MGSSESQQSPSSESQPSSTTHQQGIRTITSDGVGPFTRAAQQDEDEVFAEAFPCRREHLKVAYATINESYAADVRGRKVADTYEKFVQFVDSRAMLNDCARIALAGDICLGVMFCTLSDASIQIAILVAHPMLVDRCAIGCMLVHSAISIAIRTGKGSIAGAMPRNVQWLQDVGDTLGFANEASSNDNIIFMSKALAQNGGCENHAQGTQAEQGHAGGVHNDVSLMALTERNLCHMRRLEAASLPCKYDDKYYHGVLQHAETCRLANVDGDIAGSISARIFSAADNRLFIYIANLVVDPQVRRRAVAQALVDFIVKKATTTPRIRGIFAHTQVSNRAILSMALKLGFRVTGVSPTYYCKLPQSEQSAYILYKHTCSAATECCALSGQELVACTDRYWKNIYWSWLCRRSSNLEFTDATFESFSVKRRIGARRTRPGTFYGVNSAVYEVNLKTDSSCIPLAMKVVFNVNEVRTDDILGFFEDEFLIQQRLDHPNIMRALYKFVGTAGPDSLPDWDVDSEFVASRSLFVISLQMHTTLQSYIKGTESPSLVACINTLAKLADGIAYLHSCFVVHRDLKPDNILLGHAYTDLGPACLKIADFGCALDCRRDCIQGTYSLQYPNRHVIIGGPAHFLPPEIRLQTPGSNSILNYAKSDIWSMGMIAHAMLSNGNSGPFSSEEPAKMSPSTYCQLPEDVPPPLQDCVRRMLSINFADRLSPLANADIWREFQETPFPELFS